jgi:uncharacterized OB-fold protein
MAHKRPPRAMGPGNEEFWQGCERGELLIQKCGQCGHRPWPVVQACEQCGSDALAFEAVSGKGRLASWCTFERPYYGELMPVPYDTILVELDEGPWFIANPLGFANVEAELGMAVKVAFLDCEDSHGPFRLPVFEKA